MAEVNQSRRRRYAASPTPLERARESAGALSPVQENRRPQAPASAVAPRTSGASLDFLPRFAGRGARYNKRRAPLARQATTLHKDQIATTPGRTQPDQGASPGSRLNKDGHS